MRNIAIVGAGMAGSVLAMYLVRRGMRVTLFERGDDPRQMSHVSGRSINLTLTRRGLDSLADVGVLPAVLAASVPVSHRLVHAADGSTIRTAYGKGTDFLYSINRMALNRILLDHLERQFKITPLFNHRVTDVQTAIGSLTVTSALGEIKASTFDTIIGADGAFSSMRRFMQKTLSFSASVGFSSHANVELGISCGSGWSGAMDVLHVWPRRDFMLIAFPNQDGSFTCTFQAPTTGSRALEKLKETGSSHVFLNLFADVLPFLDDPERFLRERIASQMVWVKSDVWHHKDRICLLGDAAHGVYPSMGQGANAAFEDCRILDRLIGQNGADWATAFATFAAERKPATDALCDLSIKHFEDLRLAIDVPVDPRRLALRQTMGELCPEIGTSLYSNIAFTHQAYDVLIRNERVVDQLLDELCRNVPVDNSSGVPNLRERLVGALYA